MKRVWLIMLMLMLAIPAFASVGVLEDGTQEGIVTDLNAGTGLDMSVSGSVGSISLDQTTDLTFNTNLTAIGRYGGVSTVASSATNLAPANLPYLVLQKMTYGGGSLDLVPGTTLPNGTSGQILVLYLRGVSTNGGWKITPVTAKGWTDLTLDTAADTVMLMYVNSTTGWIILQNSGCTVTLPASFANDKT